MFSVFIGEEKIQAPAEQELRIIRRGSFRVPAHRPVMVLFAIGGTITLATAIPYLVIMNEPLPVPYWIHASFCFSIPILIWLGLNPRLEIRILQDFCELRWLGGKKKGERSEITLGEYSSVAVTTIAVHRHTEEFHHPCFLKHATDRNQDLALSYFQDWHKSEQFALAASALLQKPVAYEIEDSAAALLKDESPIFQELEGFHKNPQIVPDSTHPKARVFSLSSGWSLLLLFAILAELATFYLLRR